MRPLVQRHGGEPAEDVLPDMIAATAQHAQQSDAMQQAGDNEKATADQIVPLAAGLLFAGHETTVAAIDKGIVLLLTNPTQREALQHDLTLVPSAVEEILRYPLPVPTPEAPETPETSETGRTGGLPQYANADIE